MAPAAEASCPRQVPGKTVVPTKTATRLLTLCDWKSGSFRSLEETLQMGAYYGCPEKLVNGELVPLAQRPTAAMIVHVWEEGCQAETRLHRADLETAHDKFLEALDIYLWLESKGQVSTDPRQAYLVEGRQYPSVTHIISHVLAKPALLNWAYEMGVGAGLRADDHATPEQMAQALAVKDRLDAKSLTKYDPAAKPWTDLLELLHRKGLSMNARRDGRGSQGTTLHKNILFYLNGNAISMEQAPPWLAKSMSHFAGWATKVGLEPVEKEQKVVNTEYGYAGTVDAIGWMEWNQEV